MWGEKCGNDFLDVTGDHKKAIGKLIHDIKLFWKCYIELLDVNRLLGMSLESLHACKLF